MSLTSQRRPNLPAILVLTIVIALLGVVSFLIISMEGEAPNRPSGPAVWGGAFLLGLVIGGSLDISGLLRRPQKDESRRRISLGGWLGIAGIAIVIRLLVPEVLGWPIGLVASALLAGLFLPILLGFLLRQLR